MKLHESMKWKKFFEWILFCNKIYWAMFCSRPYWIGMVGANCESLYIAKWWIRHLNESAETWMRFETKTCFAFEANDLIIINWFYSSNFVASDDSPWKRWHPITNSAELITSMQFTKLLFIFLLWNFVQCIRRLQVIATTYNIIGQQKFILKAAKQQPCQVNIVHLH